MKHVPSCLLPILANLVQLRIEWIKCANPPAFLIGKAIRKDSGWNDNAYLVGEFGCSSQTAYLLRIE